MHAGGREGVYTKFAEDALKNEIRNNIVCAQYRGDKFYYNNGIIK